MPPCPHVVDPHALAVVVQVRDPPRAGQHLAAPPRLGLCRRRGRHGKRLLITAQGVGVRAGASVGAGVGVGVGYFERDPAAGAQGLTLVHISA